MSTMTEAQTKQIVGACSEISEKNGWTSFSIDVGSQYPVRLSTKLPALIEQARTVGDARSTWTYKESQGGENPNKPGTHYTNRYLEGVQIGGTVEAANAPVATTQYPGQQPRYSEDEVARFEAKERRYYRSRAWAQAISALPWQHQPGQHVESIDAYFLHVQKLQRKIFQDVCGSFAYPADDSDIPFGA